jgi:hypothetical protein
MPVLCRAQLYDIDLRLREPFLRANLRYELCYLALFRTQERMLFVGQTLADIRTAWQQHFQFQQLDHVDHLPIGLLTPHRPESHQVPLLSVFFVRPVCERIHIYTCM